MQGDASESQALPGPAAPVGAEPLNGHPQATVNGPKASPAPELLPDPAYSEEGNGNGVSSDDIQMVQNLIERCLQMYMTRDEVVSILKEQATIDPGFTKLVWTKLEEQNPEFFRCYYTRLKLKAQIVMFNHLLEQQVGVVQRMQRGWGIGGSGTAPASATSSGIPLFQGGRGAGSGGGGHGSSLGGKGLGGATGHPHPGPPVNAPAGHDQVVPGDRSDFSFNMHAPLDASGPSPLFGSLPHVSSDQDLAGLGGGHGMPTPGDHHIFPPNTSPLNPPARSSGLATLPRNFSLSDLGLDGGGGDLS